MKKVNTMYVLIAVLAVLLFAFLWYTERNRNYGLGQATPPPFETTSDLDGASKNLDSTDFNQMDTELNQMELDSNF